MLSEGSIGAHTSEMPVGTYKKAHRHGPGAHVLAVNGTGHTLLWDEGSDDFIRGEWKRRFIYAPPDGMFHQHFNTSPTPARYLAFLFGSKRYPIISERRANSEAKRTDVSVKDGGSQIDYLIRTPRIHAMWLKICARPASNPAWENISTKPFMKYGATSVQLLAIQPRHTKRADYSA